MQKHLLYSACAFGLVGLGAPAFAQETPQGETAVSDNTIKEIIVTAERRVSTAQKTAAAVSVRSGDELMTQGRYSLANILEDVPGVDGGAAFDTGTSNGSGTSNPARGLLIRGIQSNNGVGGSTTATSAAAAIYVDDVYNGIGGGYDIDRVEILRGPQGTLYGRSATSGVVAIRTRAPDLADLGGDVSFEVGNYGLMHASGALNVPMIEDKLGIRISGNHYERNSFFATNGGEAVSTNDARVKLLAKPTENLSVMLGFAYNRNDTHSTGYTFNQSSPGVLTLNPSPVGPGFNETYQYWGVFDLDLGGAVLTYVPAFRSFKTQAILYNRGNGPEIDQTIDSPKDNYLTQELRLHSDNGSSLLWQTGVMYYRNSVEDKNNVVNYPDLTVAFSSNTRKTTEQIGAFAEGTYAFTPSTKLTAGIRYDYTRVDVNQTYLNVFGGGIIVGNPTEDQYSIFPDGTVIADGGSGLRTYKNVTWKVRLEQNVTPSNLLYASVSTGFSPGDVIAGTSPASTNPEVFDLKAETLTSYEIGSKNRFFNDKLQVNGAVFYYDYAGFQVANINVQEEDGLTTFAPFSIPVKSYGLEMEILAKPWANGQFSANLAYTNAEYKELPAGYEYLWSSKKIPGIAPWQGNASYSHTIALGDQDNLILNGSLWYNSSYLSTRVIQYIADNYGTDYVRVKERVTLDLNAMLSLANGRYSISGYIRNVTNNKGVKTGNASVSRTPPIIGDVTFTSTAVPVDPRTFGVVFTGHF